MRWTIAAALASALWSSGAFAQEDTAACIDGNADAQKLERAGKLRESAAKLVWCASARCPEALRNDCAAILARVTKAEPTVAVETRDAAGAPTSSARVWIDGEERSDAGTGRAVAVDPGEHVVRVALGGQSRELRTVFVEGEKDRRLAFDFAAKTVARFRVPWLAWTLAGVSVVSAGLFGYFGVEGGSIKSRLDGSCAATRSCAPSEYFDMKTSLDAANVFAAVAGGALGLAILTAIVWPRTRRPITVGITFEGAGALLHGTF